RCSPRSPRTRAREIAPARAPRRPARPAPARSMWPRPRPGARARGCPRSHGRRRRAARAPDASRSTRDPWLDECTRITPGGLPMAQVTLRGNPITLGGSEVKTGQNAPDFTALDNGLKPVKLSEAKGKVVILSSVPSLDTPTCDTETRRFNQE